MPISPIARAKGKAAGAGAKGKAAGAGAKGKAAGAGAAALEYDRLPPLLHSPPRICLKRRLRPHVAGGRRLAAAAAAAAAKGRESWETVFCVVCVLHYYKALFCSILES